MRLRGDSKVADRQPVALGGTSDADRGEGRGEKERGKGKEQAETKDRKGTRSRRKEERQQAGRNEERKDREGKRRETCISVCSDCFLSFFQTDVKRKARKQNCVSSYLCGFSFFVFPFACPLNQLQMNGDRFFALSDVFLCGFMGRTVGEKKRSNRVEWTERDASRKRNRRFKREDQIEVCRAP